MRVICVDQPLSYNGKKCPGPVVGDIDQVVAIGKDADIGDYYKLARFGERFGYSTWHFAILPDQSADEIEAAEQEAIVPKPELC